MVTIPSHHLWAGGEGVAGGGVLHPPALLQQQGAQPPVLALYSDQPLQPHLVILHKVLRLGGNGGVGVHHILVHDGLCTEQGEAARTVAAVRG